VPTNHAVQARRIGLEAGDVVAKLALGLACGLVLAFALDTHQPLERQHIVGLTPPSPFLLLGFNRAGDLALAAHGATVTTAPADSSAFNSLRTAVISLDFSSTTALGKHQVVGTGPG